MPAVVALLAVVAVTAVAQFRQTAAAHAYWAAGAERLEAGDAPAAQLLLQKALSVEVDEHDEPAMRLTLALAYEQNGDRQRADALMRLLAPTDAVGEPEAHRYLAIRLARAVAGFKEQVSGEAEKDSQAEGLPAGLLAEWHWHLVHAGQTGGSRMLGAGSRGLGERRGNYEEHEGRGERVPGNESLGVELEKAWGLYHLVTGQPRRAVEHLRLAAEVEPALWLQVAAVEGQSGEATAEQLRTTLVTARERLEQQFAAQPANPRYRILYATSLYHLDELDRAEEVLREGMAEQEHQAYRQLLAAVCVRRYDRRVARAGEGDTAEAAAGAGADGEGLREGLGELQRALELDPRCGVALERLLALSRTSPEVLEESRGALRGLIAAGEASAMAHFTLGTLDWLAGDGEQAGLHLRQALALDAALPVVANNLAHVICEGPEGDLEAALALACEAVEAEPTNPAFLDTRGRIYEKRGQWAAAAADYQRALAGSRQPQRLQQKLAEIYDRLGETALAAQFRAASQSPQPVELE